MAPPRTRTSYAERPTAPTPPGAPHTPGDTGHPRVDPTTRTPPHRPAPIAQPLPTHTWRRCPQVRLHRRCALSHPTCARCRTQPALSATDCPRLPPTGPRHTRSGPRRRAECLRATRPSCTDWRRFCAINGGQRTLYAIIGAHYVPHGVNPGVGPAHLMCILTRAPAIASSHYFSRACFAFSYLLLTLRVATRPEPRTLV